MTEQEFDALIDEVYKGLEALHQRLVRCEAYIKRQSRKDKEYQHARQSLQQARSKGRKKGIQGDREECEAGG